MLYQCPTQALSQEVSRNKFWMQEESTSHPKMQVKIMLHSRCKIDTSLDYYNIGPLCRLCVNLRLHVVLLVMKLWLNISSCHGAEVRFSLNGTTYQNNSLVTLGDIGESDDALLCITNLTACCRRPALGNWFFPNGTRVVSSGNQWDFHRTRDQMVVRMHRRRGGEDGIYHCVIPVTMSVDHIVYIGVYTASTGNYAS